MESDCRSELMSLLAVLKAARIMVVLEGPPAAGKTYIAQEFAKSGYADIGLTGEDGAARDPIVLPMSTTFQSEDLFRFIQPKPGCKIEFHDGALKRAMEQGRTLIIDEINLAPPEVLQQVGLAAMRPCDVIDPFGFWDHCWF